LPASELGVRSGLSSAKLNSGHPTPTLDDAAAERLLRRDAWPQIAKIGMQAANALRYAHRQGMVHRDIKPANLLLDSRGKVWVTDFGLAETVDAGAETQRASVAGTVRYMAPEQFAGRFDERSDVYALGVTLFELMTLSVAFAEKDHDLLIARIVAQDHPSPRKFNRAVPRDLETIVLTATARDPAQRYQTAGDLATDLLSFHNGRPIRADRLPAWKRALRRYRER
jgi:serine/threonine protein kinase